SLNLEGNDFVSQVADNIWLHIQNCPGTLTSMSLQVEEELLEFERTLLELERLKP
ncbi:hypothetical protein MKX01_036148, partial [Papaver californicum]